MMRKNIRIGTVLVGLLALGTIAAKPAVLYGALAVDRSGDFTWGYAADAPSPAKARAIALNECLKKGGNCTVVVEFTGPMCAAYRTIDSEDGDAYGWGRSRSKSEANSLAVSNCQAHSDGLACNNKVWACNSGYLN
jgi:hypothetical protein